MSDHGEFGDEFSTLFAYLDRTPLTTEERERLARTADALERTDLLERAQVWLGPLIERMVDERLKERGAE